MMRRGGWRDSEELSDKVRAGLIWSLANNLVGRAGQVVLGIVLAHLLAPSQFGVFTAALVAFSLVINVSELGVSVAVVREPERTDAIAPTAATISIASATTLAIGLFCAAPWIASMLHEPGATGSLQILCGALLIAGLTAIPAAIVQQQFRQDVQMAANCTSLIVSIAVSVPMAAAGFGPSSLAWGWVASNAASAIILIGFTGRRWRPGFDRSEVGGLLRFGLPLAGSSLLVFAVLNVDYVAVSRILGSVALGMYVLAFNLSSWPVNMFSAAVRSVSLPGFARLLSQPARIEAAFTRSLAQLLAIALPICALLAALAEPAVRFVYGDRWSGAATALVWLAAVGGLRIAFELTYDFIVALGNSAAVLRIQALWLVALIPALAIGAQIGGIRGVGIGHLVVASLVVAPAYLWRLARSGVRVGRVARSVVRPLIGAVTTFGVASLVHQQFTQPFIALAVATVAGVLADLAVMWGAIRSWRSGEPAPASDGAAPGSDASDALGALHGAVEHSVGVRA